MKAGSKAWWFIAPGLLVGAGLFYLSGKVVRRMNLVESYMKYKHLIDKWAEHWNFPYGYRDLIPAMCEQESTWDPRAYRYEKHLDDASYGLMQILFNTAKWRAERNGERLENPEDLYNPDIGLKWGIEYLAYQMARYGNDFESAVEAYNRGRELPESTSAYALAVFAKLKKYTDATDHA